MKETTMSLFIVNPELSNEWHPTKNGELSPKQVTAGSNKIVWWYGKCGHEWSASIKERNRGYGCPICAGKRVVAGVNDLKYCFPEIAWEWDLKKNGLLSPDIVLAKSHKKVWWICPLGHSYQAIIYNRTHGHGCPYCEKKIVIEGKTDLASKSPFLVSEWNEEKNKDLKPNQVFASSHKKVWWTCSLCKNEWQATVYSRLSGNGCPKCAKQLQTSFPEQAIFYYVKKQHLDAINCFHDPFENNMELDIYIPSLKIGIEYDGVHWHTGKKELLREKEKYRICKSEGIYLIRIKEKQSLINETNADHVILFSSSINNTIKELSNFLSMPEDINAERDRLEIYTNYISFRKNNSLVILYPECSKEWHPTKNGSLQPEMFTPRTNKKVWWICSKGHEYQNSISHQTTGHKCPFCSHRKLLSGFNDFKTTFTNSKILAEWDTVANLPLTPCQVMAGSNKKVWWKCTHGHQWQASLSCRTGSKGTGCPICSHHLVQAGINDLATLRPDLAVEWHPTKNGKILPTMVAINSNKRVWWKCQNNHEWQAMIESRNKGNGCPVCSNHTIIAGENDFATMEPFISKEWDYVDNAPLLPTMVSAGSGRKVWWICSAGHRWQAAIKDRTNGHNCPICSKSKKK